MSSRISKGVNADLDVCIVAVAVVMQVVWGGLQGSRVTSGRCGCAKCGSFLKRARQLQRLQITKL